MFSMGGKKRMRCKHCEHEFCSVCAITCCDCAVVNNFIPVQPAQLHDEMERDAMIDTIKELEKDRDELRQVARMALQQFEFTYGERKRGWDAKFLMGRLETAITNSEGSGEFAAVQPAASTPIDEIGLSLFRQLLSGKNALRQLDVFACNNGEHDAGCECFWEQCEAWAAGKAAPTERWIKCSDCGRERAASTLADAETTFVCRYCFSTNHAGPRKESRMTSTSEISNEQDREVQDFTEQGEELAREQIVHAITDIQEARLSHLHWAEHFEAHPEAEKQYESTGEWDNAKVHREWVEKYDNVLAILARFPFAYLVSNDFTERAQTIVHEWITLDRNEKQVPVLIDRIASALAEAATQGQAEKDADIDALKYALREAAIFAHVGWSHPTNWTDCEYPVCVGRKKLIGDYDG